MAAAKAKPRFQRRRSDTSDDRQEWLLTYGDAVTLLMTFLVLMLSVSTIDQAKFEQVVEAIKETGLKSREKFVSPFEMIKNDVQKIARQHRLEEKVSVIRQPKGITIELASSSLYQVGSAKIQKAALPALQAVAEAIKNFEYSNYIVEIEGHTDNTAINTLQFPSNWELSVNRATNIVRFLARQGVEKDRMKAAGYADTRPKLPNLDEMGNPIAANQAANRRVIIHIERQEQ